MSSLVRLADAAKQIGKPSWWLRRHLLAHERRTGQMVLIRIGQGEKRPTYQVNLANLRVLCPELFDTRDQVALALREGALVGRKALGGLNTQVSSIKEDLEELNDKVTAVVAHLRSIQPRPR